MQLVKYSTPLQILSVFEASFVIFKFAYSSDIFFLWAWYTRSFMSWHPRVLFV